jgi:hypothetical protein
VIPRWLNLKGENRRAGREREQAIMFEITVDGPLRNVEMNVEDI